MENAEKHLFTIGELAKLVGVSVRTLQYYDQKNLLKSTYTDSHKRVYTRDDLLKLLQILFLKSLGIPLEEINNKLLKSEDSADLEKIFTRQRETLLLQIANLNKLVSTLDLAISEVKGRREVGMDRIIAIMELMKQGKPAFDKLQELDERGIDPADQEGQELAKQWGSILIELMDGDMNLLKSLKNVGRDTENQSDESRYIKESAENFFARALEIYFHNHTIETDKEKQMEQ